MSSNGFKRCKCRDENGRERGAKCPKLRRANGSWNPNHGSWYGKEEVPAGPDGKRIYLRLGGFRSEADLDTFYVQAARLLDIPDAGHDGHEARMEILEMIRAAHKKQAPLPDREELHRKFKAGQPLQSVTFGEYFAGWVERRRRLGDIRKTTLLGYISHYEVHIKEVLAGVRMDRLWVNVVERVFTRIDEKNAAIIEARESSDPAVRASVRGRRPTGPVTKQRIRATLRTVLSDAERERLVSFNAAKLVKLDPGKKAKGLVWTKQRVEAFSADYERRLVELRNDPETKSMSALKVWLGTPRPSPVMVWTPAQLGVFLDHAVTDRLYALYHLIAFRGLRRGEACGVRWIDAELDEGLLAVAKQLVHVGKVVEEGDPKTEASDATIALDKGTVAVLKAHRRRQNEERLAWGEAWQDSGRIFTREDGSELKPDWVSEQFERLTFAANLPPIRLHDLRHGAATLALAAGTDMKIVSAMLRHSSLSITSDTYTSVLPEVAHEAAEASAALVPRAVAVGEASGTGGLPSVSHKGRGELTDSVRVKKPQAGRTSMSRAGGT
ncbi:site-specific integrase [Microtetraspora sp. AC03309]|uniref:site-specific integrase n=1 Tax=Microtetraspora sp. AC03309 TaxID=2779376 RepID=UPI001E6416E3|nr:site-specific integrase [Microtetraspora sp. AC03309]MCC5580617.1 site-specific integrase [Microtetraspora sp. AC03309]